MIINKTKLNSFISNKVINRQKSLFENDLNSNNLILSKKLKKKKVLVIGGAGTIGANYIKCLLKFDISELIVIDINENGLVELIRTLRSSSLYKIPKVLKTYAIDFGDKIFIKYFKENGPYDFVVNFAAHKHVRNEKDIFSIHAMINNNILKNRNLLNILSDYTPINFFCVSTPCPAA